MATGQIEQRDGENEYRAEAHLRIGTGFTLKQVSHEHTPESFPTKVIVIIQREMPRTLQPAMLPWADPSILLTVYAHSRMDKRREAQAKMIEAMGLNEETAQRFIQWIVGDRRWVILPVSCRQISAKFFEINGGQGRS